MKQKPGTMITYEQYAEQFAKEIGLEGYEALFRTGLSGEGMERFTKGYAKLAIEAQREADEDNYVQGIRPLNTPLIELK